MDDKECRKFEDDTEVPRFRKRSWWNDWGETFAVEQCLNPTPFPPPNPDNFESGDNGYSTTVLPVQPVIADFLVFETNQIGIFFIG